MKKQHEEITEYIFQASGESDELIRQLDPNSYIARLALEFTVSNSKLDLHEYLIDKLLKCDNAVSREWAEVYNIDNQVCKNEMSLVEGTQKLTYMRFESFEMSILSKILQLYNYYDLKAMEIVKILSGLIDKDLQSLKSGYIKKLLQARLDLAMQSAHLHLNQLNESRIYGKRLKEIAPTPIMKSIAYKNLGISYLYENYNYSIYYLKKSMNLLEDSSNKQSNNKIQEQINFVHNYWNYPEKSIVYEQNSVNYFLSYTFYLIKKGEKLTALKVLEEIEQKLDNDYQNGYFYYYLGLISDDKYFYKSVKFFSKSGDHFFRQLPLLALKESGEDPTLISVLSALN